MTARGDGAGQTSAANSRFSCVTSPHPRNQPLEKASPLTRRFRRTSFRRFVYRRRQKKHTISAPSRVAVALGEAYPCARPEVVFNFSVGGVVRRRLEDVCNYTAGCSVGGCGQLVGYRGCDGGA